MDGKARPAIILTLNTVAFTVCFAAWMLNGVLVTFLVDNGVFAWDAAQMGVLIGIPVLTGSIMRLPLGMLTDRYGGRPVYALLMLLSAVPMFLLSRADSYSDYLWSSLGFGLTGASFAVGIAFSSVWFSRERQGTALGIFGAGNAGAALTTLGAPEASAPAYRRRDQLRRLAATTGHLRRAAGRHGDRVLLAHDQPKARSSESP